MPWRGNRTAAWAVAMPGETACAVTEVSQRGYGLHHAASVFFLAVFESSLLCASLQVFYDRIPSPGL